MVATRPEFQPWHRRAERLAQEGADFITAGFPCQDISFAGAGAGLAGTRSGLVWPLLRTIRLVRPRGALLENVAALLGRGLDVILGHMAAVGYDAEWHCIPASAVGAPHRRDRIWILLSDADADGRERLKEPYSGSLQSELEAPRWGDVERFCSDEPMADTTRDGRFARGASDAAERPAGRQLGGSGLTPDFCNANVSGLAIGQGQSRDVGEEFSPAFGTDWWGVEPDVRGMVDGISERLDGDVDASCRMGSEVRSAQRGEARLRAVWKQVTARSASQGRGSDEQLARELADSMPALPHALALGTREDAMEAALTFVHRMREAGEALGALRDPSQPLAQAWLSASGQEADPWFLAGCGRADWSSGEWPGVPRVKNGVPSRVDRLRGLGNAVVPILPEIIANAYADSLRKQHV